MARLHQATLWSYAETIAKDERRKATTRLFGRNATCCPCQKLGPRRRHFAKGHHFGTSSQLPFILKKKFHKN